MGTAPWQPKLWTQENASSWESVKEAFRRDWEQTKADVHVGGHKMHQDVADTLAQATGTEKIPEGNTPNSAENRPPPPWADVEESIQYGYAASRTYGAKTDWNGIESQLKVDWDDAKRRVGQRWDDVKRYVRRAYEDQNSRH